MYMCQIIFAIFCLYYMHIDFGYECIVFSCIVKHKLPSLLTYLLTDVLPYLLTYLLTYLLSYLVT